VIHLIMASLLSGSALAAPDTEPAEIEAPPLSSRAQGVGVGLSLGEPTGIAGAIRSNSRSTLAGVVGWSLNKQHLHLHLDYLYTLASLKPDPEVDLQLNFFLGVGGNIDLGNQGGNSPAVGVRIPAGFALTFGDRPVDVFVELVPVMGLVPDTNLYFDGAMGIRLWFKPA
jgi:hypothetical protein